MQSLAFWSRKAITPHIVTPLTLSGGNALQRARRLRPGGQAGAATGRGVEGAGARPRSLGLAEPRGEEAAQALPHLGQHRDGAHRPGQLGRLSIGGLSGRADAASADLSKCPQLKQPARSEASRQEGQTVQRSENWAASHLARAAFTATGFSCAIQCPDGTVTSVRLLQSCRMGSARRDTTVSQV
jgi:hypothetical protein